jgi:HK97 family phage prohead protease
MIDVDSPPIENREIRDSVEGVELRAAAHGDTSPGTLIGYAAVFGKPSALIEGRFHERIAPGAFRPAIDEGDTVALYNHNPNYVLGRKSAGTLRMAEDAIGLRVEIDLPDTTVGRDVAESTRRRDILGQSFSFSVAAGGDSWDRSRDPAQRTVSRIGALYDVGPVVYPAYEDTSVAMRALRSLQEAPPPPQPPDPRTLAAFAHEHRTARLRLLEVM